MKFKSVLLAAAMAGGIALGASAANAQVYKYSVTGADPTYTGSFEINVGDVLPVSPIVGGSYTNAFYDAFAGTGVYSGVDMVSFSPVTGTIALFDDSTPLPYLFDYSTNPAPILGSVDVLTVSAAPEPGVWLLMIAGVAMIGSALRFNRKQGALAVA
jgi:hypothetical protein